MTDKKELPFDVDKYSPLSLTNPFLDGSDALGNKLSHVISFKNIRDGGQDVYFKAFINSFNESYSPNFTPNEVFGRTDPIYQYKNTTRNITLAFKVPAASQSEAYENLGRVQKLIQMLYPTYKSDNALTLSEAPLVRLKVMNLLRSQTSYGTGSAGDKPDATFFAEYTSTADSSKGLLGVITSCTIDSSLTSTDGVFNKLTTVPPTKKGDPPTTEAEPNTVLPKLIEISINFSPIHEKTLGYNANNNNFGRFPYGVQLSPPSAEGVGIPKGVQKKVKLKRTLEEARQTAASAQQDIDKAEANYKKAKKILNSMERRGEITEAQRNKWTTSYAENLSDAEFDAATAETAYEKELAGYSEFL
jgi:hypothetical protein